MKKLTLALSAAAALAVSGSVMAQDSQDIVVDGLIASNCTLSVDNQNVIILDNNTWQQVADITGACNSGSQFVDVLYTFTAFGDGSNPEAKFMHSNGNDFVGYRARVTTPNGVEPILQTPYLAVQGNNVPTALEFEPQGDSMDLAGDYTTEVTINVVP